MALRLYQAGICKTKKEASAAAGLHPNYLTMLTSPTGGSEPVKRLQGDLDKMLESQTVNMNHVLTVAGRQAIGRIAQLMQTAKDEVALKAAQDLADRSPETQKVQRLQIDSFSLSGQDAKELAKAIIESANADASGEFEDVALRGLVEVDLGPIPEAPVSMQGQDAGRDQGRPQGSDSAGKSGS